MHSFEQIVSEILWMAGWPGASSIASVSASEMPARTRTTAVHGEQRGSITIRSSMFALSQRPDVLDKGEYSDTHDRLDDFS
jgi:hypothetical protein